MNCQELQLRLDEYLDDSFDIADEVDLHVHVDTCRACRQLLQDATEIQTDLKAIKVPPMRAGFAEHAVRQAANQIKQRPSRHGFVAGFSSALVAGFALLFVVTGLMPENSEIGSESMSEVTISVAAPRTVNLVFDVSNSVENATLSIDLPGNVEIVGFPGMRRLSWQTSLTQGRNVLPLPLIGTANADTELFATLEQGGKSKTLRLKVRVEQFAPQAEMRTPNWV